MGKNKWNSTNEKISEDDTRTRWGKRMWLESVVNENIEKVLAGSMSQN